jgi:class 3 adenylate cyclase
VSSRVRLLLSRDGAMIGLALVVLLGSLTLYVREEIRGGPWRMRFMVAAAETAAAHPPIVRFRSLEDEDSSPVRIGDRLLRVGDRDLAGARPWQVYASLHAAASPNGALELVVERGGRRLTLVEKLSSEQLRRDALLALCFAATAILILLRAPRSPTARSFALAALVWSVAQVQFPGASPIQTYAYFGMRALVGFLWAPLMILAAIQFPDGAWPRDRALPRWPWLFATLGITWTSWWMSTPFTTEVAERANPAVGSLALISVLVVITRNYTLAGPLGRRQIKWVLFGCYLGLLPSLLGTLVGTAWPELTWLWFASQAAVIAVPLSILIAVTRSNLFDIDRLISATATYTVLLVGVMVTAFIALPWLADQASQRAGIDGVTAQVGFAAALAFLVMRLEPVVRPLVERVFFVERQAFQDGIDRLVADVQKARDPALMSELLGDQLDRLLRPEFCVVYARGDFAFAPIFSRHCPITPHFDPEGSLVSALAERVTAVDLERDRAITARLDTEDGAGILGLSAAVLVPIVREGTLLAFVALGRKVSGDIYTTTDLALLGMVGGSLSAALHRFGDEELLREARMLQDRLRQFVPASIADQLLRGGDVDDGERMVSVLFADLRGYTTLSEGHVNEDIFRLVSTYTETVTRIVMEHGGTVVEFNGDGLMAVFGAPEPLPDKERRALAAARRIVTDVATLATPIVDSGTSSLGVGVGLATGSAYVGAIRSVDRNIWSAIGNTTNLAARLQAMTRDFGAPIVIDEATHQAAFEEAADFERRADTAIRGLRAPRDVFILPRQWAAA